MRFMHKGIAGAGIAIFVALGVGALGARAQGSGAKEKSRDKKALNAPINLRIRVLGGEKNEPVANASVYLRFQEKDALLFLLHKKNKVELDLKTDDKGYASFPDMPEGKVLIQVVIPRWQTFGEYYELREGQPTIVIKLHRPKTRWY